MRNPVALGSNGAPEEVRLGEVPDLEKESPLGGRKLSAPFMAVLLLISVIYVFAATETYLALPLALKIHFWIFRDWLPGSPGLFSVFDVLFAAFSVILIAKFGIDFNRAGVVLKALFLAALLCFILDLVNPNSEDWKLQLPVPVDIATIVFLNLMFATFFMREEGFIVFIRRLFTLVAAVTVIRAVILLILWGLGKGNRAFGGNSALTEGDSLLLFAFVQCVLLAIYLNHRKRVYLVSWGLLLMIQILSFRRTALYVAVGANLMTFVIYALQRGSLGHLLRVSLGAVAFGGLLYATAVYLLPEKDLEKYTLRYIGIFSDKAMEDRYSYAGDSGHFRESALTLDYAIEKGEFWGYGYGDPRDFKVPGATMGKYVHNVYAAVWLAHGMYSFAFYLLMIMVVLVTLMRVLVRIRSLEPTYVLLVGAICGYLLMLMVAWYTNPISIAETLKMRVLWVFALAFVFKIRPATSKWFVPGEIDER